MQTSCNSELTILFLFLFFSNPIYSKHRYSAPLHSQHTEGIVFSLIYPRLSLSTLLKGYPKAPVQNLVFQGNWKCSGSLLTWLTVFPPESLTDTVIMHVIYPTIINSLREWHPEEAWFKYIACTRNLTFWNRLPTPRCIHGRADTFIFLDCRYMS